MGCAPGIYAIRWRARRGPQPGAARADTEAATLPLRRLISGGKGIPDRGRPPRRPARAWVARRRSMAQRAAAVSLPCAARSPVGRHIACGRSCHHRCWAISPPFPPFFSCVCCPARNGFRLGRARTFVLGDSVREAVHPRHDSYLPVRRRDIQRSADERAPSAYGAGQAFPRSAGFLIAISERCCGLAAAVPV